MNNKNLLNNMNDNFSKGKFKLKNLINIKKINNFSINTTKLFKQRSKYKDFFCQNKKLLLSKSNSELFLSPRNNNQNDSSINSMYNIKSVKYENNKKGQRVFSPLLNKTTKGFKNINYYWKGCLNPKMKIKRNYSAYYLDSSLSFKNSYISDLLIQNNENNQNKITKLSDIEKKMSYLEKKLNFLTPRKNKSYSEYSPIKKQKKENKKNELPDYLREEVKIKGTNILSPFCMKSRDKFIMKKLYKLYDKNNSLKMDKKFLIDNRLNIMYAENEEIYKDKLKKINKYFIMKGKNIKYKPFSTSRKQLKDMEKEVIFMKDIFKYVFPNTAMLKLKDIKKYFKRIKKTNFKNSNDFKK